MVSQGSRFIIKCDMIRYFDALAISKSGCLHRGLRWDGVELRIRRPIAYCGPQHRCSDAPEILCTWLLHTDEPFVFCEASDMQPWQLTCQFSSVLTGRGARRRTAAHPRYQFDAGHRPNLLCDTRPGFSSGFPYLSLLPSTSLGVSEHVRETHTSPELCSCIRLWIAVGVVNKF